MLFGDKQQQSLGKIDIPAPGTQTWGFKLGDVAKDQISGIQGTLTNRFFHLSGCDRFVIETEKDGELKHITLDGGRVELVESRPQFHRASEIPDSDIKLGDKIKDVLSGLTGIATVWNVPLHGAIQIMIDPGYDAKKKVFIDGLFVDAHLIEVVTPYKKAPEPKAATPKKTPDRGPTRVATRGFR